MITDFGTRCREVYAPADEVLQAGGGSDPLATDRPVKGGGADGFDRSRAQLEQIVEQLTSVEADGFEHGELEVLIEREGRAVLRQLFQDRLDLRALRERRLEVVVDAREVGRPAVERDHRRQLSSVFGEVRVDRLAYRARGQENLYVADGVLNLPAEHASHGVRRLAARAAAGGSFEDATGLVRERTGLDLGKRQVEELAVRAAVDFDAFYAERVSDAEERERGEQKDVLVLSCDGKGIVMRSEALREQTAKAAQRASPKLKTRLSRGEKANRKRIAEVGAVYELEPAPRTPADVLAPTKDKTLKPPKAKHKWLTASVLEDAATVVADIFEEAERRDGKHQRAWVALVDGNNHQIDRIRKEARRRKVKVTIVVDLIHVMEYLWSACWCFFEEGDPAAERWVHAKALAVLEGKAGIVAASIRRKATKLALPDDKRKNADRAADYLLNKAPYLDYPTALSNGWPIATGVIEGACRHLVKDRMDITGARWGLDGAEAILKLRALITNGDFDDYWQYHLTHERHRNHDLRYANGVIPRQA
ncbi:MAG: ISKra4 family transposase [Actinomycetota bacterium]|nr:ISKra4 family transposase [Actinomycetota bacterium]